MIARLNGEIMPLSPLAYDMVRELWRARSNPVPVTQLILAMYGRSPPLYAEQIVRSTVHRVNQTALIIAGTQLIGNVRRKGYHLFVQWPGSWLTEPRWALDGVM